MIKSRKILTLFVSLSTATAMTVTSAGIGQAHPEAADTAPPVELSNEVINSLDAVELEEALLFIELIPDYALESEAAFNNWLETEVEPFLSGQSRVNVGACSWAITKAVVANAFVFTKITKLRQIIRAAGGAGAVARKASDAYNKARQQGKSHAAAIRAASDAVAVHGGPEAQALLLELFSIDAVINNCFKS